MAKFKDHNSLVYAIAARAKELANEGVRQLLPRHILTIMGMF